MASNPTNNLIGKLFDMLRDRLIQSQRRLRNVAIESDARAKQLIAEGKLLPIPPLPTEPPQGVSPEELAQVEATAAQLQQIPWGNRIAYPAEQAPAIFASSLAEVDAASGDGAKLHRLAQIFAGLPRPLCYVGAAEVMFRLSHLRGMTYAPVGLRQGLRFAMRAQVHTLLQPDALIAQLKLLAACREPYWQELATKTLAMIWQVAPDHPRLPLAEMLYHRIRGEYEEALMCADRALRTATSPVEAASLLSSKASLLMSVDRYADAVLSFQNATSLNPSDPWLWHNASIALTRVGHYHEALQCSERALAIMDFGAARAQHERIMESLAQQLGGGRG